MTSLLHISTSPRQAVTTRASRPERASDNTHADRLVVLPATRHLGGNGKAVAKRLGASGGGVRRPHRLDPELPTQTTSAAATKGQAPA